MPPPARKSRTRASRGAAPYSRRAPKVRDDIDIENLVNAMHKYTVADTVTPEYDASGAMDIQAMRQKLVDMLQSTRRKPARRRKPATSRRKH